MKDGDLDSDIVWHEYGHGLTWRMIGRMDGPLAGAIGEGMSDVLALIANDDDRVGEYSASDPVGIRSAPYTGYSRTYGDIAGTGVHFDGEVYGAIGWELLQTYQPRTGRRQRPAARGPGRRDELHARLSRPTSRCATASWPDSPPVRTPPTTPRLHGVGRLRQVRRRSRRQGCRREAPA